VKHLNKPVYESLPSLYVLAGALLLWLSYRDRDNWWSTLCAVAGLVAMVAGLVISMHRRDYRATSASRGAMCVVMLDVILLWIFRVASAAVCVTCALSRESITRHSNNVVHQPQTATTSGSRFHGPRPRRFCTAPSRASYAVREQLWYFSPTPQL